MPRILFIVSRHLLFSGLMKTAVIFILLLLSFAFSPPFELQDNELEAFYATNEYRVEKHRKALVLDTFLCKLAREHSENMANGKVNFGHGGFQSRSIEIKKHLHTGNVAENVFMASSDADGFQAVKSWINSKNHRKNMLNKDYHRVGLGLARGKKGTYYTQIFCY